MTCPCLYLLKYSGAWTVSLYLMSLFLPLAPIREFSLSTDFVKSGDLAFSPDIIRTYSTSATDSIAYFYRVKWASDTLIPLAFRTLQLTPGFRAYYAPAFVTLMAENDGVYEFFEWGQHTTTHGERVHVLYLKLGIDRNDILNLIADRLLRLSFIVDYDCTALSFDRLWDHTSTHELHSDLQEIFHSPSADPASLHARVGRRLPLSNHILAREQIQNYDRRRLQERALLASLGNGNSSFAPFMTPNAGLFPFPLPSIDVIGTPLGDSITGSRGCIVHYCGLPLNATPPTP